MSRTIRRVHPRTLIRLIKVDINPLTLLPYPEPSKRWERRTARLLRGQDGTGYGELHNDLTVDRAGSTKMQTWDTVWGRNANRRRTNRQQRIANQLVIKRDLEDHYLSLDLDYEEYLMLDWYDDEEMELPDWWYDPPDKWDKYDEPPFKEEGQYEYYHDYDDYEF